MAPHYGGAGLPEGKALRNTRWLITPHRLDDKMVLVPEKIMGLPRRHGSSWLSVTRRGKLAAEKIR